MGEVFLDAFIDSLKILAVVLVFSYIIALIEPKLSNKIKLKGKLAPLIGVSVSLLPQCGFSVVATDLYHKKHITVGTLVGVYLATSDEALPIFLSNPGKALDVLPLIALKFALGLVVGYALDFAFSKSRKKVEHHIAHCEDEYKIRLTHCDSAELVVKEAQVEHCDCDECAHSECPHEYVHECHLHCDEENDCHCESNDEHHCDCHNHTDECHSPAENQQNENSVSQTEDDKKQKRKKNIEQFVIHPLLHSIEIFAYVFVVNIIFGIIFYYVGEEKIISFLTSNKYIAPLFSVIVGAIPNCVSSVAISELYLAGGLGFGAALGGLCMNAGVGFVYLFKNTKHTKSNILIFILMFALSVAIAYIFSAIFKFDVLHLR